MICRGDPVQVAHGTALRPFDTARHGEEVADGHAFVLRAQRKVGAGQEVRDWLIDALDVALLDGQAHQRPDDALRHGPHIGERLAVGAMEVSLVYQSSVADHQEASHAIDGAGSSPRDLESEGVEADLGGGRRLPRCGEVDGGRRGRRQRCIRAPGRHEREHPDGTTRRARRRRMRRIHEAAPGGGCSHVRGTVFGIAALPFRRFDRLEGENTKRPVHRAPTVERTIED